MIPGAVVFDIDKTLARSKQPITPEMAQLLAQLIARTNVGIISGGALPQFLSQIVEQLPDGTPLESLYLLPTSGAALYVFENGEWKMEYEMKLSENDATHIIDEIRAGAEETGLIDFSSAAHGERIENRGTAVTLSALGQQAPVEEKEAWDPEREKKEALRAAIAQRLPAFDVKVGGSTSIDVTRQGVNKAFGVRKLAGQLEIPVRDMLYIGDALFPGGNDEVVKETSIPTHQTSGPEETGQIITSLLAS